MAGTRVVVVGSGVVGAAAAWYLARQGVDATIIDGDHPGRATAAGAGIIAPGTSHRAPEAFFPLTFAAAARYPEILAGLQEDGENTDWYGVVGALFVAMDEGEARTLGIVQRLLEERRAHGVSHIGDISHLDGPEARTLFPPLAPVAAALHIADAARLDGRHLRASLMAAAERRGARVRTGTATPLVDGGRVRGVRMDGDVLEADAVILAGGAWSRAFAEACGVRVPVYPQRGQILHVRAPGEGSEHWPVVLHFGSHYLVSFPDQRLVAGATREDGAGFDTEATAGGLAEVLAELLRVAPGAASASLGEVRVGLRPATADHLPILGAAPGVDGLYLATGHGANGLTAGPYSGILVARQVLGQELDVDLAPYSVTRFA